MKANQFRIGNLVQDREGRICEICHLSDNEFRAEALKGAITSLPVSPIPLTEEWLLRMGFVSNPYNDTYERNEIKIECDKTKGTTQLWIVGLPHIEHVHSLQNLFFALTGEELKIKTT